MTRRLRDLLKTLAFREHVEPGTCYLLDQPRGRTDLYVPEMTGAGRWGRGGGNNGHFQDSTIRAGVEADYLTCTEVGVDELPGNLASVAMRSAVYGCWRIELTQAGRYEVAA